MILWALCGGDLCLSVPAAFGYIHVFYSLV